MTCNAQGSRILREPRSDTPFVIDTGTGNTSGGTASGASRAPAETGHRASRLSTVGAMAAGGAASLATVGLTAPLMRYLDIANILMLCLLTVVLLTVVLVAAWLGRGPAVVASVVGVAAFDFVFVPPQMSFAVNNFQYLVTFAVMLSVGILTAQLTTRLRTQLRRVSERESRSRMLYEFARELSSALQTGQIFESTRLLIEQTFGVRATLLLPDAAGRLQFPPAARRELDLVAPLSLIDQNAAQWAFDQARPAGLGSNTIASSRFSFLPLVTPMRTRGVLAIKPLSPDWMLIPEDRHQLDTLAALAALALERVHYIDVAQEASIAMASERLRNALLSAISHDLRTPLTALVGLSDSLLLSVPPLSAEQQDLGLALHDEALRMSTMVGNLLDMARLQSGAVEPNLQWLPIEEVVGTALRASRLALAGHAVRTELAPDLPLVRFDAVLIERVLCNLLENAAKYTPPGSRIAIAARLDTAFLTVEVQDNGPGMPAGLEKSAFEKFVRGQHESALPGVGLGLAICQAIIAAHGGLIAVVRPQAGGTTIRFRLPLGIPPSMPDLPETDQSTALAAPGDHHEGGMHA